MCDFLNEQGVVEHGFHHLKVLKISDICKFYTHNIPVFITDIQRFKEKQNLYLCNT